MKATIIWHVEFTRVDNELEGVSEKSYEICLRDKASLISQAGDAEKMMNKARINASLRIDDFVSHGMYKCFFFLSSQTIFHPIKIHLQVLDGIFHPFNYAILR